MCKGEHHQPPASLGKVWLADDTGNPSPRDPNREIFRPDILDHIEKTITSLDNELRTLSLDIHGVSRQKQFTELLMIPSDSSP
jgi:hypothetical protein